MNAHRTDPRRSGARILDTAQGVLIGLRRCTLSEAFIEIVRSAQSGGLGTMGVAEALVALAENAGVDDLDPAAVELARSRWGPLLEVGGRQPYRLNHHLLTSEISGDATEFATGS